MDIRGFVTRVEPLAATPDPKTGQMRDGLTVVAIEGLSVLCPSSMVNGEVQLGQVVDVNVRVAWKLGKPQFWLQGVNFGDRR